MRPLILLITATKMSPITLKRERVAVCVLALTAVVLVMSLSTGISTVSLSDMYLHELLLTRGETFAEPYHKKSAGAVNVTARFLDRQRRLREVCRHQGLRAQPETARAHMPRLLFPTPGPPTVLYCPVPRVGTSFLRRVIALANNMDPYTVTWRERFHVREVTEGYDHAVLFFFTREPFSRLLSTYINKLWMPNPEYWAALGGPVIGALRNDPTMAELACGSDVTFPELISYVILSMTFDRPLSNFLKPSYKVCQACNFDYKYIGHLETFSEDASYIMSAVNLTVPPDYDAMEDDEINVIDGYVYLAYFTITQDKSRCVSKYMVLLRTWRALQIRGLISTDLKFPLQWEDTQDLKRAAFRQVLHAAHNKTKLLFHLQDRETGDQSQTAHPGSRGRASTAQLRQRKMALASAWSLVPMEDREKIRKLYEKEFLLFGYDPHLDEVFSPKVEPDKDIFDLNSV